MKKISNKLKVILLAIVLALGMSYMGANATWESADGIPPLGNASRPINHLSPDQTREGSTAVAISPDDPALNLEDYKAFVNGAMYTKGIYSEGKVIINKESGDLFVGEYDTDNDSSVFVGGKIGVMLEEPLDSLHIDFDPEKASGVKIQSLSSTQNPDQVYSASACVDASGKVTLCSQSLALTFAKSTVSSGTCAETVDVTVTPGGAGVPPYSYSWSTPEGNATIVSGASTNKVRLSVAKEYLVWSYGIDVTVTDANGIVDTGHYGDIGIQDIVDC